MTVESFKTRCLLLDLENLLYLSHRAVKGKHKIPQERVAELMVVLKEFYKEQNNTDEENEAKLIEFAHNFEDRLSDILIRNLF